jgi:hypothetical protein
MVIACFVTINVASAQDKKEKKKYDPEARWNAIVKGAEKAEGTTELTKDEFVKGVKAVGGKRADQGEELFKRIKKADESKITKDEFIKGSRRGKKNADKKPDEKKPDDK